MMSAIHIFSKKEDHLATSHGLEQSIALVLRISMAAGVACMGGWAGEDRYLAKAAVYKANNERAKAPDFPLREVSVYLYSFCLCRVWRKSTETTDPLPDKTVGICDAATLRKEVVLSYRKCGGYTVGG